MRSARVTATATLLALALGACGSDDGSPPPRTSTQPAAPLPPAALPAGWHRVANDAGGYAFALPRGWKASRTDTSTVIRSADRALAGSITADRSTEALGRPAGEYASAVARALSGYRSLEVGPARRVADAPYPAFSVTASGTYQRTGVDQEIVLVALSNRGDAVYSLVFFRSARTPRSRYASVIERIVKDFRATGAQAPASPPGG